jgi:hypothetical protein
MLILMVSPILAVIAGQGHWPLMPTKARVYPSGAALTHPTFQLYVLRSGLGFEVAVAWTLVLVVVLIDEHAVNTDLLDRVEVTSVVELDEEVTRKLEEDVEDEELTLKLEEDVALLDEELELEDDTVLEVVDGAALDQELELEDDTMLEVELDQELDEVESVDTGPVF